MNEAASVGLSQQKMPETQYSQWSLAGADDLRAMGDQLAAREPSRFRAQGRRWSFSGILVSDVSQTALTVKPAAFDPLQQHYISVTFVRNGQYDLFDADRRFTFRAGDAGYMRGWDQVKAENPVPSRVAMVSIHEDRLAEHGVFVSERIGAFHASTRLRGPSLSFVLALMDEVSNRSGPDESVATQPTADVLAQLMAGLFLENAAMMNGSVGGESLRSDSATIGSAVLTRADSLILRQASDARFTPGELAAQLNISLRQLQRVFSQRGSTPAEAIRARRLELAIAALRDVPQTPRSVGEIAVLAGFSSLKELRFALRLNYGVTPREFLAAQSG